MNINLMVYIHVKLILSSMELVEQIVKLANRVSSNIELQVINL